MEDIQSFSELVSSIGVPVLFCLLFAYALFKLGPEWLKVWKESKAAERNRADEEQKSMQEYYNQRNKSYEQQMEIMNTQANQQNQLIGQATQVIARSNEVIAGNTEAMKQNSQMHQKVQDALSSDLEATREVATILREHDKRSEKIYTTALRISDKVDRVAEDIS
ncbi:hypothetical protein LJC32_05255 [Oscillospiraceae bacterium OttesenSCG-928-F05]|nr:hypothetical protein [Oscillospiraceae bacterium OttesenSCG-928-F05]